MFKKILVPIDIDYPKTAAGVYQKAKEIADAGNAEIKLVSVMPGFGMPIVAAYISDEVRQEALNRLQESLEQFIKANCDASVTYTIRTGKNWEQIIRAADKWGADLIVAYHNRQMEINDAFSNSCARNVAEHANCSVLRLRKLQI